MFFDNNIPANASGEAPYDPPSWQRPPDHLLPGILPVEQVVAASDEVVMAVECIEAYPTGFIVPIVLRRNPFRSDVRGLRPTPGQPPRFARLGIRYADGREAGRGEPHGQETIPKDPDGLPTEIYIAGSSFHGDGRSLRLPFWVHPLPPAGRVEIFALSEDFHLPEGTITVEGRDVRVAGHRAVTLWRAQ